jgi:hypothetical protein
LRQRVIGVPEISTDGFHPYKNAIRDAFAGRAAHGLTGRVWAVGDLIEAALTAVPPIPTATPTERRRSFRVIQGDLFE